MDPIQMNDDLRYVRDTVERAERHATPAAIYFFWAAVGPVGFALVDFRPQWVPAYWSVAGPAGFVVSAVLGWRHARRMGQYSAGGGERHLLHWGGMLGAIALAVLMNINGLISQEALGPAILLILALGYFQAGVHIDRTFLWLGLLMAAGYVFVIFATAYAWTVVGLILAVAFAAAGLRGGRPRESAA